MLPLLLKAQRKRKYNGSQADNRDSAFNGSPCFWKPTQVLIRREACLELSSLGFCLMPGRKTKHGRSWVAHQRETIKHHSQRSCHLLEVVSASRVQNGTCLKKFKRFLYFPLQAKYQSCKTTYTRQISPLSAGKTHLSDSRERKGSTDITTLIWSFPLLQQPQAEAVSEGRMTTRAKDSWLLGKISVL